VTEKLELRGIEVPAAISYSLLAALVRHLPLDESIVKMQEIGISSIHYDIADEVVTLPAELSHTLRTNSSLAFDYHIAKNDPSQSIDAVALHEGDFICAHIESLVNWSQLSARSKDSGAKFGVGLNVGTDWRELEPVINNFSPDFILIMAAEAGKSGGSFDYKTLEKIHRARESFPNLRIHVDGGIDDLAAASLRGLGVELLVSGSYIHSGLEAKERLAFLQGVPDNPRLDSLLRGRTPLVFRDASWGQIIEAMEYGGIGCAAVLDENKNFIGIITNHDIRVNISNGIVPSKATAGEICNKNSFIASPDEDFWTFMLRMQKNKAMHTVVPLVSDSGELIGIIRTQDALFRDTKARKI